jgi:hypothetical protein
VVSIGMIVDVVAAVTLHAKHAFIAVVSVVAVMMHADAVWAYNHGISHVACRKYEAPRARSC